MRRIDYNMPQDTTTLPPSLLGHPEGPESPIPSSYYPARDPDCALRVGVLSELTGEGTEFLLSADRTCVIAHFFRGNFVRGESRLSARDASAQTIPALEVA